MSGILHVRICGAAGNCWLYPERDDGAPIFGTARCTFKSIYGPKLSVLNPAVVREANAGYGGCHGSTVKPNEGTMRICMVIT